MCFEILIAFREENGRVPLKIFVEFLRPVIKEERENTNEASTSAGPPSKPLSYDAIARKILELRQMQEAMRPSHCDVDFYCPLKYERAHIHMPGDHRREPRVELERVDAEWKCTMCRTNNFRSRTRCRNCREEHNPPSQSTSTGETGAPRRQRSWSEGAAWDSDEAEDTEWAETHPFWHE